MKTTEDDVMNFVEGMLKDASPVMKDRMLSIVAALQEAAWILDPTRVEERLGAVEVAEEADAEAETETEPDGAEE